MKPLYWKLLLILGAMIVGASLVVPKALRKEVQLVDSKATQTVYLTQNGQGVSSSSSRAGDVEAPNVDVFTANFTKKPTNKFRLSNLEPIFIIKKVRHIVRILNAGIRPTKSRVID